MYKKKLDKRKKTVIIISTSLAILILLAISLTFTRDVSIPEKVSKEITNFFQKLTIYPFSNYQKFKDKDQTKSCTIEKNANDTLKEEVKELKELLELNKTLTEYDIENATILSRNKSYWFNTLEIDKGSNNGLKKDMAVITANGLIGKISKVYPTTSEVKLITSDDVNYKVSVAIKLEGNDTYATLNGYDYENNLLKIEGVDKAIPVKENDVVVTSGLGEVFPAGIYVGTVDKIESDKYNLSRNVYIKTKQNFNSIHYVTVLKEAK